MSFDPDNPDYVPSRHKGYNVGCWSNCLCRQARLERVKSRRIKKMEEEDKLSAAASLLCLSSSVSNVELQQQSEEEDYLAETESNTIPAGKGMSVMWSDILNEHFKVNGLVSLCRMLSCERAPCVETVV